MMAFWNRRNKDTEKAEDSDESYYMDEKENGRSRLASFVFGVAALLITLLIATAVVFGVRAIYRAIHGGSSNTTNVTGSNGENGIGKSGQPSGGSSAKSHSQSTSGQSPSTTPSTGDNLPSTGDNIPLPKTGDPGM